VPLFRQKKTIFSRSLMLVTGILLLLSHPLLAQANFPSFGTVTVSSDFNLNGTGSNVDTIAFYEAPNPQDSLMFVTSKNSNLVEVWAFPYTSSSEQNPLTHSCINAPSNGVFVDQEADILYVSLRHNGRLCSFHLPNLNHQLTIDTQARSGEPNLGLLKLTNGQKRVYMTDDNEVFIHDANDGRQIGHFNTIKGLETIFGDPFYQVVYTPDEKGGSGIYIYDPDGKAQGSFGGGGIFDSDEEGIWLYTCPSDGNSDNGEGLIIVSDQKSSLTDFEVFHRVSKDYLGMIHINGVNNTDGIASTQQSSSQFPLGIFVAIDDDSSAVGVGWDKLFSAISSDFGCGSTGTGNHPPLKPTFK